MKVRFFFESRLARTLNVGAITLYPFVFCASNEATAISHDIVQHEMVHVEQVRRYGWFGMYGRYVTAYGALRLKGLSHADAYSALELEQEAYARQNEPALLAAYHAEKQTIQA